MGEGSSLSYFYFFTHTSYPVSPKLQTRRISHTLNQIGGTQAIKNCSRDEKAFLLAKINLEKGKITSAQKAAKVVIELDVQCGFYVKAAYLACEYALFPEMEAAAHKAVEFSMGNGKYAAALEIAEEFGIVEKVELLRDLKELLSY